MAKRVTINDDDTITIQTRSGRFQIIPSKSGIVVRHWRPTNDHYTAVSAREGPRHSGWGEVRIQAQEWE